MLGVKNWQLYSYLQKRFQRTNEYTQTFNFDDFLWTMHDHSSKLLPGARQLIPVQVKDNVTDHLSTGCYRGHKVAQRIIVRQMEFQLRNDWDERHHVLDVLQQQEFDLDSFFKRA